MTIILDNERFNGPPGAEKIIKDAQCTDVLGTNWTVRSGTLTRPWMACPKADLTQANVGCTALGRHCPNVTS